MEHSKAKKSLGQHWLDDERSLRAIVEAASIKPGETVLEIGPGQGSLTKQLLNSRANVIAIEKDEILAAGLRAKNLANLEVVTGDILKFDLNQLQANYKVVANIPYYLTAHLLRLLSETANPPELAVLLVQKEVAERVCTAPGQMSVLSVGVQLSYKPELGQVVPAELFTPPPKVDSQLLILISRKQPLFEDLDRQIFFRVVKAGFGEKRKKLRSSLSGGLNLDKKLVERLLRQAGIDVELRAQNLSLADWYKIHKVFQPLLIP